MARRRQAISTIYRLLRPTGRALITVWAKDQSKSNYLAKNKIATENVQVNVNGVNLHIHENRTQFQHKDLLVPWKLKMNSEKSRKKGNKLSKSDNNLHKNMKYESYSECLESDNTYINDNNSANNDSNSPKNNNNMSKNDNNLSKNDNNLSKTDNNLSKTDKGSKSKNKSSERNIEDKESTLLRYYHVFEEGELDDLCREVGFEIESTFYEEGNWCVICKKLQ